MAFKCFVCFLIGFSSCQYKDDRIIVWALTYTGCVYFWGKNFTDSHITATPTIILRFGTKISKIACGADHCLARSADGKVC